MVFRRCENVRDYGGGRRKVKGYITERRKGMVSWIRFREEGLSKLLKGVEICCKESSSTKRIFDWKENGRNYRLKSCMLSYRRGGQETQNFLP